MNESSYTKFKFLCAGFGFNARIVAQESVTTKVELSHGGTHQRNFERAKYLFNELANQKLIVDYDPTVGSGSPGEEVQVASGIVSKSRGYSIGGIDLTVDKAVLDDIENRIDFSIQIPNEMLKL